MGNFKNVDGCPEVPGRYDAGTLPPPHGTSSLTAVLTSFRCGVQRDENLRFALKQA